MIRMMVVVTAFLAAGCVSISTTTRTPAGDHVHGVAPPIGSAADQSLAAEVRIMGPTGAALRLGAAELAAMPHATVNADFHGEKQVFEGVELTTLLARVGAPTGQAMRGKELDNIVVVTSRDGYRVVLALAETDATVRSNRIILADKADGAAIPAADGPFRLVVEGDLKPARSARMVSSIEWRRVD